MKNTISRTIVITQSIIFVISLGMASISPRSASACTAFQLTSADGARIYFRSMEFGFAFDSQVLIVPRGTELASDERNVVNTDTTEWVVSHDRTNLRTYVRTYGGLKIQMIDLKQVQFDKPGLRTIELQNAFEPEDVTATAKPLN